MDVGKVLKYYRMLHELTQSEVAELSGINEKYLGRIERNESVPTIDKIEQLCMAFDIRVSDFVMANPDRLDYYVKAIMDKGIVMRGRPVYYCNCCGCSFEVNDSSDVDEIRCPECGCLFDTSNDYIERYTAF